MGRQGPRQREGERPDQTGRRRVREAGRTDDGNAFMADPGEGRAFIDDDLAETLAEEFVRSATTGNDTNDEAHDQVVPEEIGGPFIETTASEEFADGPDGSNPDDATSEPLPKAVSGLSRRPDRE